MKYNSLQTEEIIKREQQAAAAAGLLDIREMDPAAFAAAVAAADAAAATQALRRLQAAAAAAETLRELSQTLAKAAPPHDPGIDPTLDPHPTLDPTHDPHPTLDPNSPQLQQLLSSYGDKIRQTLAATIITEQREVRRMRKSLNSIIENLVEQRNQIFARQQQAKDTAVLQQLLDFGKSVSLLQEDIYFQFCNLRKRYERALTTRKLAALPGIQQRFAETAEELLKEFTKSHLEEQNKFEEKMNSEQMEFSKSIQQLIQQTRRAMAETQREIESVEQLSWSRRETMQTQIIKAYHSTLSQNRLNQLAYKNSTRSRLNSAGPSQTCGLRAKKILEETNAAVASQKTLLARRNQHVKAYQQRVMIEVEDFIRKLKVKISKKKKRFSR
ncbi:hypothetical protein, conserved [Eimeria tenella]|uniref:Uncharacterized protein n=1 Tax=Eimeria tenella TaxID=5802 RepID=U6KY88_EIMTE|nr:hypothetical protein, conserved [Eimeria tenella]CDJ43137.1 hypothetical protein, conserved [Eimeria tenella]|eukprot:XP_013233887.1 hypothetical protein, conserved [Eimeria tenella]